MAKKNFFTKFKVLIYAYTVKILLRRKVNANFFVLNLLENSIIIIIIITFL
jgi:hypothetical protein